MRLFIAIPLEEKVRLRLLEVQQTLRARAGEVSWVAPDNFHLTLHFLGETAPDGVPDIQSRMQAAAAVPTFEVRLHGLGRFARGAIWAGLSAPPQLNQLLRAIGAPSMRHPHVTLGRSRDRNQLELDDTVALGVSQVTEIMLIESQLSPKGAIYTVLHTARLAAPLHRRY